MRRLALCFAIVLLQSACTSFGRSQPLVLITDFGTKDGAVSAMKGVAASVHRGLVVSDLTHDIQPYNIWEAGYRLQQTYKFWPEGTVFVSVIDPGVGSTRKSVVARSNSGHIFVGPDNGTFTLVGDESGFSDIRVINEKEYRRKGSEDSYTFHGRDLYAHVGALLAAGQVSMSGMGPAIQQVNMARLEYQKAELSGQTVKGTVPVLDVNFGNVWTNIPRSLLLSKFPHARKYRIQIFNKGRKMYEGSLPLVDTFSGVAKGAPLLYFNSMLNLSVALNMANFAQRYAINSGPEWSVTVTPVK